MLQDYFTNLTDPRQPGKIKHKLLEMVIMTICAVIAGCDVWEDIVDFCRVKEQWFKESLQMELANGIPSHDTMQRVWAMIHPKSLKSAFAPGCPPCAGLQMVKLSVLMEKPCEEAAVKNEILSTWSAHGPAKTNLSWDNRQLKKSQMKSRQFQRFWRCWMWRAA